MQKIKASFTLSFNHIGREQSDNQRAHFDKVTRSFPLDRVETELLQMPHPMAAFAPYPDPDAVNVLYCEVACGKHRCLLSLLKVYEGWADVWGATFLLTCLKQVPVQLPAPEPPE